MDRNAKTRLMWRAEAHERATKEKGRFHGNLGQTGLALMRCLLFRFGGPCAVSYKALRRATGFCLQTISDALKRLEDQGFVFITHRRVTTPLGNRVLKNAYDFPRAGEPASVVLPRREVMIPLDSIPLLNRLEGLESVRKRQERRLAEQWAERRGRKALEQSKTRDRNPMK